MGIVARGGQAKRGTYSAVTRDKKIYVPFVVTDYPFPVSEKMDLNAHIRFLSPPGQGSPG